MRRRLRALATGGSVQRKLLFSYAIVILAMLILLNSYPLLMTQNMIFRSKQMAMQDQALLIAGTLPIAEKLTADSVEQSIRLLEDLRYGRILVTNETGLVLYDSEGAGAEGRYATVGGIVAALSGKDVFSGNYENGAFFSHAAVPVMGRGRILGAVYLHDHDESQGLLLKEVQNNLRVISLLICGLVIAISVLFSRLLSSRFSALFGAIRRVREGEYTHRIKIEGQDEFSHLGGEFNELTGRLQVTEEARRRFVADASHELKTPLAAIKLLTDSILQENMSPEMQREFVGDIAEAAERLIRISEDLLTMNRLDATQKRHVDFFDFEKIISDTCLILMPLAQAARQRVELDLQPCGSVLGNEEELSRLVSNLMENAIKYNNPGGWLRLSLRQEEGYALFTVEDTGVGIPEEDLPHIFERFYRVDKARSREAGGTGLGLALVREIIRLHGGGIAIENRAEGGLRVQVRLRAEAEEVQR